jgi:hypothetical protein
MRDVIQAMPGEQEVWLIGERRSSGEQKYYSQTCRATPHQGAGGDQSDGSASRLISNSRKSLA